MRFLAKDQKIFKVGKIRKYDEEGVFSSFESLPCKNGKAENIPVVASRLVLNSSRLLKTKLALCNNQLGRRAGRESNHQLLGHQLHTLPLIQY